MRLLIRITLTCMLALAIGSAFAIPSLASAEETGNPLILPNPSAKEPLAFTGTGGEAAIETATGTTLVCKTYSDKGEMTSGRAGAATIDFTGCQSLGVKCNTAGDPAGTILDHGALHVVDILPTGTLALGIQANLSETGNLVFTCGGLLTVEVRGAIIAAALEVKSGQKLKSIKGIDQQEKGKQAIKECDLPLETCIEGKANKKFLLEMNTGKGFTEAGLAISGEVTFSKEIEVDF